MIAFLLDTKLGHLLIGLLCILIAGAGMYWRGHNKGWDSATAHYVAVVNSCMAANSQDARTIRNLEAANQELADAAKANAAKVSQALAQLEITKAADARALGDAQAKLHRIEAHHGDAHAAAVTHIPPAVYRVICTDGVCEPADRTH